MIQPAKHSGIAVAGEWSKRSTVGATATRVFLMEAPQTLATARLLRVRSNQPVQVVVTERYPKTVQSRRFQLGGASPIQSQEQGTTTYVPAGLDLVVYGSVYVYGYGINNAATVDCEILEDVRAAAPIPPMEWTGTLSPGADDAAGSWTDVGHAPDGAYECQVSSVGELEYRLVDDAGSPATYAQWLSGPDPFHWRHGPGHKLQVRHPGQGTLPAGDRSVHVQWWRG
jgi:hypothetical protein